MQCKWDENFPKGKLTANDPRELCCQNVVNFLSFKQIRMSDCNISLREMKKNENQLFESKNNVLLGGRKKDM